MNETPGKYKNRYNILIEGTFSSGSSAVIDLLREYRSVNVFNWEFNDYRAPGLVADQLGAESSKDYPNRIDEILVVKELAWKITYQLTPRIIWENEWNWAPLRYFKSKNRIMRLNQIYFLKKFNKILKSDISYDEKILSANSWIQSIGTINSRNKVHVVFNQPLDPKSDPDIWTRVFDPYKLICIYRDPKDQIAELIKRNILFLPFNRPKMHPTSVNILSIYGRDRQGMVRFLAEALKCRLQVVDDLERKLGKDNILIMDFEGLVNNYNNYTFVIESFLKIREEDHIFRRKYFNPDMSRNNIGIYDRYLNRKDLDELVELEQWYRKRLLNTKYS